MKVVFLNYWIGASKKNFPINFIDFSIHLGTNWGFYLVITLLNFRLIISTH